MKDKLPFNLGKVYEMAARIARLLCFHPDYKIKPSNFDLGSLFVMFDMLECDFDIDERKLPVKVLQVEVKIYHKNRLKLLIK